MLFFEGNNRLTKQFSRGDNETMNTLFDYCSSPPHFNPCKPHLCSSPPPPPPSSPMLIRVNPVYRPMVSPQILEDPLISSE